MTKAVLNTESHTEQSAYADRVKTLALKKYGKQPAACVVTFGCQQNVSDSERLKGMLVNMGYSLTENEEEAQFIIFNTCAVREHAEDRVYGNVGATKALKRKNPDIIVAVCGCMAQRQSVADKIKQSYPYVDMVLGTQVQHRLPEFIYRRLSGSGRIFDLTLENGEIPEGVPIKRDGTFKGWLPIMYGCNNYCIVPYVRGRERSREPEQIINEAKQMIASGCKDITLLGQNVNSYGKGEEHGLNFSGLLRKINELDGDFRIRFMTSHPRDCTKELIDTMRDCEKVSSHLHLPFQSGSDRILKLMNRHYDRKRYLELVNYAKEQIPDLSLTTDIIVGFPGETYEDFKETLSLVRQVEFSSLFTFIYSPREGTPAAVMEDPVSREEKGKWFSELCAAQEKIASVRTSEMVGREYRVLCESKAKKDGYISGRTQGNIIIEFPADESVIGSFRTVRVTEALIWMLKGELAD